MSTVPERLRLGPAYSPAVRDLRGSGLMRGTVVGLLVGTALLSGCSQKTEANDTLPSTSTAPTTEDLPQVGPPDFPVPDEARAKDAAGAEAFLRYWIDLLNRQQAIPAGQPLRDLGPECRECLRIARVYDEAAAAGNHYVGGLLTVVNVATPMLDGDQTTVAFTAREDAVQLVDAAGTALESLDAAPDLSSGIGLAWSETDRGWLVTDMTLG
jgi:hypothetical protein